MGQRPPQTPPKWPPRAIGLFQFLFGAGLFIPLAIWHQLDTLVGCFFYFPEFGMLICVVFMLMGLFTMLTGIALWDPTKSSQYQRTYERTRAETQAEEARRRASPSTSPASAPPPPIIASASAYPAITERQRRILPGVILGVLVVLAIGAAGLGVVHQLTTPDTRTYTDPGGLYQVSIPVGWYGPGNSDYLPSPKPAMNGTDHAIAWRGGQQIIRYFEITYTENQSGDQTTLQSTDEAALRADLSDQDDHFPTAGSLQHQTGPRTVMTGGVSWVAEEADIIHGTDQGGTDVRHEVVVSTYRAGSLVTIIYGDDHASDFATALESDFQPILKSFKFLQ